MGPTVQRSKPPRRSKVHSHLCWGKSCLAIVFVELHEAQWLLLHEINGHGSSSVHVSANRGHPLPISPFPSTSKVSVKVGCNSYFTRRNQRSTVWMYSPCPVQTPLSGDSKRQSTRVVGVGLRRKQAVGRTCTKHPRSVLVG